VLKWLSEFSEKLQKRADSAAMEINGLLDEAGIVELDLKNTYNSFRNLSYHQFVDHASTALDCWIVDSKGISSEAEEHGPSDLFDSPMFGMQQGLPEKDGTEPLVSAALDFKAMLEAALLNPYKFYDEESLSVNNAVSDDRGTGQTHMDVVTTSGAPEAVSLDGPQHLGVIEEKAIPVTEGNLTSLQDPDIHASELYSALVSGSLFDAEGEEDSLSFCQKEPVDFSAHASTIDANEIVDGTQSLSIHENLGSSDQSMTVHVSADTSISTNEESGQKAPLGDVNALEKDASLMGETLSSHRPKEDASSSFVTSGDDIRSHNLVPENSGDHHGPLKVNIWEDPLSPSKWKEEHFVLASLGGWFLLGYAGYKLFGGKKEKKEEVVAASAH
ncbi:hypothetical protein COCNU_14G006540, partial [Cocos nucifera]